MKYIIQNVYPIGRLNLKLVNKNFCLINFYKRRNDRYLAEFLIAM